MCGIAGIYHFNKNVKVDEGKLQKCRDILYHRGPDYGANYIHNNIGLAHRRLKIIDLTDSANQPMISQDGNFIIVFNGEIYNYLELKKDLLAKGCLFKTNSDTEVLLQLFIEYGANMLHMLNGMFAFAILNKTTEEVFIARDRLGIKPLFFYCDDEKFVFASEIKALLKSYVEANISEEELNELLLFRFVAGEKTLFKNIVRLLPGHYLTVTSSGIKIKKQWWNLKERIQKHDRIKQPVDWFFHTFNDAVDKHLIADVPVGVLLSGGLDSSSICASLKLQGKENIKTFNVGFSDAKHDETPLAKQLATDYNFPFFNLLVEGKDLYNNTMIAVNSFGDTLVHQSEPQLIAISKLANKHVKILLSGEGADELMGGYVRYKAINFFAYSKLLKNGLKLVPDFIKSNRTKKFENYLNLPNIEQAILFNSVNNYPSEFEKLGIELKERTNEYRKKIFEDAQEIYPESNARQAMYLDLHTYLCSLNDRNDRTTMAASIECRVPFLDYRLVEGVSSLPNEYFVRGKKGKYLLTESFKNLLPKYVLDFRKIGFSVPWVKYIFENPVFLDHWSNMHTSPILQMGFYKLIDVTLLKKRFEKGDASAESLLRQIFFITLWYKFYVME